MASPEDVDTAVSQGLGLRWSFMGPFQTIDLNAPNGPTSALYHSISHSSPCDRRGRLLRAIRREHHGGMCGAV